MRPHRPSPVSALLVTLVVGWLGPGCGSGDTTTGQPNPPANDAAGPSLDGSPPPPTQDGAIPADANPTDAATAPDTGNGLGIASHYPCDQGIDKDPAYVFGENFEEGSVSAVTARYDSSNDPAGMALVTDVPSKSCGKASMKLTSGVAANATDLYKQLPGNEELWVRWYVKYQAGIQWHHSGMWFGGYNPATPYASPHAGLKPNGDDRISVAIEPVYGAGAPNPRFDFYNYWMQMHSWMTQPMGNTAYYGNALAHQSAFTADDNAWICLESHVKLNTDPSSATGGELDVWKNDALVQHFDGQTPAGCSIKDNYCPKGADGTECTTYWSSFNCDASLVPLDLQWRSTAALQLNYFWPQNYITSGPDGSIQLDDMVVAKARIGCIH